ncbi:MAG: hypothetical protein HY860_05690 [Chlamydiales bacterium]|nr:hypothetical protein [Chlamydiales bacterium]
MKRIYFLLLLLVGCAHHHEQMQLTSIQIQDKNNVQETISIRSRLQSFEKVDFLSPQPYEKVFRIYKYKGGEQSLSKITSYHQNGHIHEYLEARNNRAYGQFKRWHENGTINMAAHVIEGAADLTEESKVSWVFDGIAQVYDNKENLVALIPYEKGQLEGDAVYYFPNKQIKMVIPYRDHKREGVIKHYNADGELVAEEIFTQDVKNGNSYFNDESGASYVEEYLSGKLVNGKYYSPDKQLVCEIVNGSGIKPIFERGKLKRKEEYQHGIQEGRVEKFSVFDTLENVYHIKDGLKHGDETIYYPTLFKDRQPEKKLTIDWVKDEIQGKVTTWYDNETKESEREYSHNQKHGMAFAWYKDGHIMLVEQYDEDKLVKGKYFKKEDSTPISQVIQGNGIATIFDEDGHFVKKATYKNGVVSDE